MSGIKLIDNFFRETGAGAVHVLGTATRLSSEASADLGRAIARSENAVDDFRRWVDDSAQDGLITARQARALLDNELISSHVNGIGLRNRYFNQVDEILSSGGSRETIDQQLEAAKQNFVNAARADDVTIQIGDMQVINDAVNQHVARSRGVVASLSDTANNAATGAGRNSDGPDGTTAARNSADGPSGSNRMQTMWNWHRIRMAGLGITVGGAGIVLGDQFIGEGNLAKGAGAQMVNFGDWVMEWNPELGQRIMDLAPDLATTTMDAMSASQDAMVRASVSGLREAGHEEVATGLMVGYVATQKSLGIAIRVADEDENARSAVFVDEFCREADIDKEDLEAFLRDKPVMVATIQGAMETIGADLNDVFPDLQIPSTQNLSEDAVRAMIQQERESYDAATNRGRTLSDMATNPMIPGSLASLGASFSERMDALEDRVDNAVDRAVDEASDQMQMGFISTIVMAAAGMLSWIFGKNAMSDAMQSWAMEKSGVEDRFDNLRESVASGDVISQGNRDRFGVTGGRGPSYDIAEPA